MFIQKTKTGFWQSCCVQTTAVKACWKRAGSALHQPCAMGESVCVESVLPRTSCKWLQKEPYPRLALPNINLEFISSFYQM